MSAIERAKNLAPSDSAYPDVPDAIGELEALIGALIAGELNDNMVYDAATATIDADRQLGPADAVLQVITASAPGLAVIMPDATDPAMVEGRPWTIVNPAASNEVQTLTVTGGPTGGTFKLTFSGQETDAITYSTDGATTAANIEAGLEALSNIESVAVTSEGDGVFAVEWTGADGATSHPLLALSANNLTGGTSPGITIAERWDGADAGESYAIKDAAGRVLNELFPGDSIVLRLSGTATVGGVWQQQAHRKRRTQVFTSSGTWTKRPGLRRVKVWCTGGGGAGGGITATAASRAGGGGAAGATSMKLIDASDLAPAETVTVGSGGAGASGAGGGSGGTSSFGAHLSAPGGAGGDASSGGNANGGIATAAGSGGDIDLGAGGGGPGSVTVSGHGGASFWGGGARSRLGTNIAGDAATAPGAGGGGAVGDAGSAVARAGGDGGAGLVVVEEFY